MSYNASVLTWLHLKLRPWPVRFSDENRKRRMQINSVECKTIYYNWGNWPAKRIQNWKLSNYKPKRRYQQVHIDNYIQFSEQEIIGSVPHMYNNDPNPHKQGVVSPTPIILGAISESENSPNLNVVSVWFPSLKVKDFFLLFKQKVNLCKSNKLDWKW